MPMTLAEILGRAIGQLAAHFTNGRIQIKVEPAPRPGPREAGSWREPWQDPYRPLTKEEIEAQVREWIWTMGPELRGRFPGGRPQFEQACNAGYVRWTFDGLGLHVNVGPPPGAVPPGADPPPRRPPTLETTAAALRTMGFKKYDEPTANEIRERWRALAKRHHPDLNPRNPARSTARMQRVNQAYDVLKAAGLAI